MIENATYTHYSDVLKRTAIPDEAAFAAYLLENRLYVQSLVDDGIISGEREENGIASAVCMCCEVDYLTDAAIKGKVDPLIGLKENVIIGKLIPAGSGMPRYRDLEVIDKTLDPDYIEDEF